MLEAVESGFGVHSERMEEVYRTFRETLDEHASRELRSLEKQRAEIERVSRAVDAGFEAERAELNARIEDHNETAARLETDIAGSSAAIESYRKAYEIVLAELRAARALYRELDAEVQARREALNAATEAYRSGTSEDAREIARLENDYRRFASRTRDALQKRETALRNERESLRTWLRDEAEELERAARELEPMAKRYTALEEDHDRLQRDLNQRIEVYHEQVRAAGGDDAQSDEAATLEDEIDEHRESLQVLRDQAAGLAVDFMKRRAALEAGHEALEEELRERRAALHQRGEELRAEQRDGDARMKSRHAEVQARIETIENRVRAHLATLREEVDMAERRLDEEFGPDPEALHSAATEWTASLDPALLYDATGAARFDPLPLRSAAIYQAVDAVRRLESEAQSAFGLRLAQAQRQRTRIDRARQDLIERQEAFAARHAELQDRWSARFEAVNEELELLRDALDAWFDGKLSLLGFELQALQGALLDALGTPATAQPPSVERDRLLQSVTESATRLKGLIDLDSAHAHGASLVETFATTGASHDPNTPDIPWERPSADSSPQDGAAEERLLEGEDKRRFLAAWYGRLDATGTFDPLLQRLAQDLPSHSAAHLRNALRGLFDTGLHEAGDIVGLEGTQGASTYQIRMLDRSYWIHPDGHPRLVPSEG